MKITKLLKEKMVKIIMTFKKEDAEANEDAHTREDENGKWRTQTSTSSVSSRRTGNRWLVSRLCGYPPPPIFDCFSLL